MKTILDFLANPTVIGWIPPIVIPAIIGIWTFVLRRIKEKRVGIPFRSYFRKPIYIFEEYCKNNRFEPIISYSDNHALEIRSEIDRGNIIIRADIDFSERPNNNDNRNFVMILLKYIPKCNLSYFYKKGYNLMFDIKSDGRVTGIQLEIKDANKDKVVDEFVDVTNEFHHHSLRLKQYSKPEAWKEISEICFTIFDEKGYILDNTGKIEIRNCILKKEK